MNSESINTTRITPEADHAWNIARIVAQFKAELESAELEAEAIDERVTEAGHNNGAELRKKWVRWPRSNCSSSQIFSRQHGLRVRPHLAGNDSPVRILTRTRPAALAAMPNTNRGAVADKKCRMRARHGLMAEAIVCLC